MPSNVSSGADVALTLGVRCSRSSVDTCGGSNPPSGASGHTCNGQKTVSQMTRMFQRRKAPRRLSFHFQQTAFASKRFQRQYDDKWHQMWFPDVQGSGNHIWCLLVELKQVANAVKKSPAGSIPARPWLAGLFTCRSSVSVTICKKQGMHTFKHSRMTGSFLRPSGTSAGKASN